MPTLSMFLLLPQKDVQQPASLRDLASQNQVLLKRSHKFASSRTIALLVRTEKCKAISFCEVEGVLPDRCPGRQRETLSLGRDMWWGGTANSLQGLESTTGHVDGARIDVCRLCGPPPPRRPSLASCGLRGWATLRLPWTTGVVPWPFSWPARRQPRAPGWGALGSC